MYRLKPGLLILFRVPPGPVSSPGNGQVPAVGNPWGVCYDEKTAVFLTEIFQSEKNRFRRLNIPPWCRKWNWNLSRCIQVSFKEREPKLSSVSPVHDVGRVGDDADGHGQRVPSMPTEKSTVLDVYCTFHDQLYGKKHSQIMKILWPCILLPNHRGKGMAAIPKKL